MPFKNPPMPIELASRQRKFPLPLKELSKAAELALKELGGSREFISIVFMNDRTIREVNKKFRNKDKTTDVLSFRYAPEPVPDLEDVPVGEILISVETASRQAEALKIPLVSEVLNLIIHGLCHVFGYDHEKGKIEADRMRNMERHIARRLLSELEMTLDMFSLDQSVGRLPENTVRGKIPDPKETRES